MDLFTQPWRQDLQVFLEDGHDLFRDSYSVYTPIDLYRNDRISGKMKNELYFTGRYFSPYPVSGSPRLETDGKVYCVEYSKFPFGRVSHFLVLKLLSAGTIDGYSIDADRQTVVDKSGRTIRQADIEAIGRLASRHFIDGGVKYILEIADAGNCANVIELT